MRVRVKVRAEGAVEAKNGVGMRREMYMEVVEAGGEGSVRMRTRMRMRVKSR